jgi:hypothetical protein
MAFCSNCGNALGDGQQFCANCGQPAAQVPAAAAAAAAAPQSAPQPPVTPQPAAYAPPPAYSAPPAGGPGYPPPPPPPGPTYAAPPGYPPAPAQAPGPYGQPAYAAPPAKRSRKGLWIGLSSALLVVVIACVLVFVVFRGDIFGGGDGASDGSVAKVNLSAKDTPSAIMAASMLTVGTSESVTGSFDVKITVQADTSSLPAEQAQLYAEPWTLSGDLAFKSAEQAGDFKLALGMMGETMNADLRMLGDKIWIGLADQWYEAPASTETQVASVGAGDTLTKVQDLLSSLAIDPTGWLKNQAPVQEEKIDGVKVLHISGSDPNWPAMVGDLAKIMMSPEFQSLMDSTGSTGSSLESQLPSPTELLQLGTQLDQMFQNVKVDIWVEKDTARLRKAAIVCDVTAPADTSALDSSGSLGGMVSSSGITGMSLDLSFSLNPGAKVNVEAPADAKTSDQLQSDLQANPALLGPLGEMLMSLGSSSDTTQ